MTDFANFLNDLETLYDKLWDLVTWARPIIYGFGITLFIAFCLILIMENQIKDINAKIDRLDKKINILLDILKKGDENDE